MATTSASGQHRWRYDVFVSFRGEDIRKSFMDHLFNDFKQKGINVFRDDNENLRGEELPPELYKAIEESWFLIVVFSKKFASSSWCLRELVKIFECKRMAEPKHEVRIVFYDVKADVVRKQTGSYADAFIKHEISNTTEQVANWKEALRKATNIIGCDLQDYANGYESRLIESISKDILDMRYTIRSMDNGEKLVGVDDQIEELDLSRFSGRSKVHMLGICGISGIGKTTLAKAIYDKMCMDFIGCCFFENVQGVAKAKNITKVQMQIINSILKTRVETITNVSDGIKLIKERMASKPILLVLDDVDDREQLEALAGSPDWFSPGSLIIFTGKDKQLFHSHKVDEIYAMPVLLDYDALELFSLYAFGGKHHAKDFMELAYPVVKCLQGHPLALKVLGCSLYEKPLSVWKSELERLKTYPNAEIQQKLRPSFNGLDFDQQRIFLDIAFSFIGENKDFAASVINEDCTEDANIDVLVDKSLITISPNDNSLQMHELIRSMAREIVREESNSPGRRSRLWPSDVHNVLNENKASETVEVLDLLQEESSQKVHIDAKAFAHMKNLRILKIRDINLGKFRESFDLKSSKDSKINYSGRLEFLSNKLRLFYWHGCPFKFFPSDFYPENIVAIDLSYSRIENLWWTTPKCFGRLKVMNLSHCRNLKSAPDFTMITNITELILEGCVNLVKFHPSFGVLKRLVILNMRDCKRFRRFPSKVEMDSLEVLILSGCLKVDKLPESFGTIQNLKKLYTDRTAITDFPSYVLSQCNLQELGFGRHERIRSRRWTSISHLSWLRSKMQHTQSLVMMPSLESICSLKKLNFSGCNILEVPDSIGGVSCLEELRLDRNNFTSLPGCMSQLRRLTYLSLIGCKKLEELPELPPNIYWLFAYECTSLQEVPSRLLNHDILHAYFTGCPKLFRNDTYEYESQSEVSMLQPQPVNSCITSHSSTNHRYHSFLRYMNFPSNTNGFFYTQQTDDSIPTNVSIIYHGNRIPQWFTNRSTGNHIKVDLPPDWCISKFKLRGYGICVVFTPNKSHGGKYGIMKASYCVDNFDGTSLVDNNRCYYDLGGYRKSYDIIWFYFMTRDRGWEESKNVVTFSFEDRADIFDVKECGVRLVFDEDIEEDEQNLSFIRDLPTPTQDGGVCRLAGTSRISIVEW